MVCWATFYCSKYIYYRLAQIIIAFFNLTVSQETFMHSGNMQITRVYHSGHKQKEIKSKINDLELIYMPSKVTSHFQTSEYKQYFNCVLIFQKLKD